MNDVLIGLYDRFWNELARDVGYDDFYSSVKQKQEIVFDVLSRNLRVYPTLRDAMGNSFEQFEQAKEGPLPNRLSEVIDPEYYSYYQSSDSRVGYIMLKLPSQYQVIYKIDPESEVRENEYGIHDIYIVSPHGSICNPVELVHEVNKNVGTSVPPIWFAPSKVNAFEGGEPRIVLGDLLKTGCRTNVKLELITPSPILHEFAHLYIKKIIDQGMLMDERDNYFVGRLRQIVRAILVRKDKHTILRNLIAGIGIVRGGVKHSLNGLVIGILREEYFANFFAVSCLNIMNQEEIDRSRPFQSDQFIHLSYMELCRALHEGYEMLTSSKFK